MIALDPEFIGSFVEQRTGDSKDETDVPFARQSRLQRLRLQGKADESEVTGNENGWGDLGAVQSLDGGASEGENRGESGSMKKKEKIKMRGKGKSLKRYLRKQRKNVIDPKAVSLY